MTARSIRKFIRACTLLLVTTAMLSIDSQDRAMGQTVQLRRPFTVGVTRKDATIIPLLLAQDVAQKHGMPIRIVSIDPQRAALALLVKEIDLLYTDGVSALTGALSAKEEIVFIAAGLDSVIGSVFTSPSLTGFADPKVKDRAVAAVISYPKLRTQTEVTYEFLALRAILRKHGIKQIFVLPSNEPSPEEVIKEQTFKYLKTGGIDFAFVAPEQVSIVADTGARQLKYGQVFLQGILIVARRTEADGSRQELREFVKAFSSGIRTFNDPIKGPRALAAIGLKGASAEFVYDVYRENRAFLEVPVPNLTSISNLIAELSFVIPDAKRLNARRLVHLGPLRKAGMIK